MNYMRTLLVCLLVLALGLTAAGCSKEETTFTGIVVSVDGTVISVMEMSGDMQNSERPQMSDGAAFPDGSERPQMSDGTTLPDGSERPQLPDGATFPEDGERPQMPDDATLPEDDGERPQMPDGATFPEDGETERGFGRFFADAETKQFDIANAHISVEIDEGKATGSTEDVTVGSFVTLTLNSKGEVTNVLVSSMSFRMNGTNGTNGMSGFGGGRGNRGTISQ